MPGASGDAALVSGRGIGNHPRMSETEPPRAGDNRPVFSSTGPYGHRARMRERPKLYFTASRS